MNSIPDKKNVEEHCKYVCELARISFFYAYVFYTQKNESNQNIVEVIQKHTPLFYHALEMSDPDDIAVLYPDWNAEQLNCRELLMNLGEQRPEWQQLMAKAQQTIDKVNSAQEFENAMFDAVEDLALKQAKHLYIKSVGVGSPTRHGYNAGSLKYDPPSDKRPANYCNFHIANAIAPKSIFDDPRYLPECFMLMMDKSEKQYVFDTLSTGTWLNDNSRFLALFPQEWIDNLSPRTDGIGWSFGNWGQMVTARGTFNYKAGNYLREHGTLRYAARSSHCSFVNMRKKLSEILSSLSNGNDSF